MSSFATSKQDESLIGLPRIGHLCVASDEVGEAAFRSLIPESAARIFTARMAYIGSEISGYAFRDNYADIVAMLPLPERLDVLVFGCTAASIVIGPDYLENELAKYAPKATVIALGNAVVDALKALSLNRIAVLTPYPVKSHTAVIDFLGGAGFDVVASTYLGLSEDVEIGAVSAESILRTARALTANADVDGLFISCAGLPVVEHIEHLEKELALPIVVSSQAAAWKTLQILGLPATDGPGKLMRLGQL
ncbi:MAG: maleate cis-trans isomerase family protein [Sphingorhabdus sp.]